MPISFVTERAFKHFYPYPEIFQYETYNLFSYAKVIANINMLYKDIEIQLYNPCDLLIFILDYLDNELKVLNPNYNKPDLNYDKKNLNETISNNYKNYLNKSNIITKTLNWYQLSESRCLQCQNSTFKFLSFTTFNLDILNTYEQNLKKEINQITISDCLNVYGKPIVCKLKCDICNNSFQNITKQSSIFTFSKNIIFLLNRGINFDKANKLMNIKMIIEEKIDLSKFVRLPKSPKNFELTGIVSISLDQKKYVCYSKSPIDKNWYYYNDEIVEYIQLNFVLDKHNNSDNNNIPCILLYTSII